MTKTEAQVQAARRRMILGRFGQSFAIALFSALVVVILALAAPAFWAIDVDPQTWRMTWIFGGVAVAFVAALAHAILTAPSQTQVAAEVDRRFGLRERLSSSLGMQPSERESDFGLALAADAEKRAEQIEVADKFGLSPSRVGWMPLALVPVLAIVVLLVDPVDRSVTQDELSASEISEIKQVKAAASDLKKRLQQQKRKAESQGLKEAKELFEKLESDLDKITQQKNLSRKQAMIAMNDLKKQLEQRRDQIGSPDKMRQAMSQMKGLESGPADKMAKSIQKGDFGKAKEMVKELADKIRNGDLTEKEKQQLKKQIDQMKKQLQDAVKKHEEKKQELQDKIDQARKEGRGAEAAKMQQQLNEMQQQDSQMQKMQQMADAMGQAGNAMQQGNGQQAADALQNMADQLGDMEQEMSELQDLESAMNQLSQSKNQMRCEGCQGAGCQQCQGNGMGQGKGEGQGNGLGEGSGSGDRPESENETNTYETQVRGQVRQGKAIIAGFADGPNRKGISREDVKSAIQASLSEESDPLENQTLPKAEQEHVQQYFDRLRTGE